MLEFTKKVLKKVYLEEFARDLFQNIYKTWKYISWQKQRKFGRVDRRINTDYFKNHESRKLHIGCGNNIIEGWLNANFSPRSKDIIHLDATQPFPFANSEFDYVFSEHMIEHIRFSDGCKMLGECFRILKENGKIRISTPNLAFLVALYQDEKTTLQKDYCLWANSKEATDNVVETTPYYLDTFVINNFVRDWGHEFIYDEKTLQLSLETVGFVNVSLCKLNESESATFRNLENENRMPAGFMELESIIMEGTKWGK